MDQDICLDQFLDSVRAAGVTDSEGEFTISHAQAVQKMARYSLPYPQCWVLKIVQAAVVWRAPDIRVSQTRLYTTIEFCPREKKDIPTEEEVVSALVGTAGAGTVPVGKLCLGLRTLVRSEDYSFLLTLSTGRTEARPLYAGRDAQSLTRLDRMRLARYASAGIKIVVIHLRDEEHLVGRFFYRFLPWWRRDRQIAFELQRSAAVCSTPITINKRSVTLPAGSPVFGSSRAWEAMELSGITVPGDPWLRLAQEAKQYTAWYLCHARIPKKRDKTQGRLEERIHEVHWVCEGVIVQTEVFPFPTRVLKLTVFMNAEGLQTDITGMLLQESEAKSARWSSHFPHLQLALQEQANEVAARFPLQPHHNQVRADLQTLAEFEKPALTGQSRQTPTHRTYSTTSHGVQSTQTEKYVSEVVTSEDGKSHMVIKPL